MPRKSPQEIKPRESPLGDSPADQYNRQIRKAVCKKLVVKSFAGIMYLITEFRPRLQHNRIIAGDRWAPLGPHLQS